MKFDLSKIESSDSDTRRGVSLPVVLSEELAEFIGIVIGDGHLGLYYGTDKYGSKSTKSDIVISGNKNEGDYHSYITNLFNSLFNIKLTFYQDTTPNAILLRAYSKGIVQFLNKICEIPVNRKTDIVFIPEVIKKSNSGVKCAFLRGLADTDFSLTFKNRTNKGHNYPVIKGGFKSKYLINDLEILYAELGFSYCVVYNEKGYDKRTKDYATLHCIYLNGRDNFTKWVNKIGFSNPKFIRKVEKWQRDGFCPQRY